MSNNQTIQLLPLIPLDDSTLSYADRLKAMVDHAPERTTINTMAKPYDWAIEGNQKRPIK